MPVRYCKLCVQPDTRPGIIFNDEGICPACVFAQNPQQINWQERHEQLEVIIASARKNHVSHYDCIIGVSGGKDSTRQALYAKQELGLNPLLVCCGYPPEQVTYNGVDNLANLITLGFDTISVSPAPLTSKKLMRESFFRYGNIFKASEMALYSSAPRVAINYHIPLVFLGENPAITVGALDVGSTDGAADNMKNCNTLSGGAEAVRGDDVEPRKMLLYHYSSDQEQEYSKLKIYYLGYFIKDFTKQKNAEISIANGMKIRHEPAEDTGDITGHEALDDDFVIVNQMIKYIKFGFGKVNDQVSEEIRLGRMTREQAIKIAQAYDGKCHPRYIEKFCRYLEIETTEFWKIVNNLRHADIWSLKNGKWCLNYPLK